MQSRYIADFDTTMLLRETADYKSDFSLEGTGAAVECAVGFLAKTEELLAKSQ